MNRLRSLLVAVALLAVPSLSYGQAASAAIIAQSTNASAFPWWAVRKVGYPILEEANFTGTFPNTKFGVLLGSTGTVTADTTNLLWGGTGSAKLLTAATNGDGTEIKATIAPIAKCGDLLAFELKFATTFAQATTELQIGLESRDNANIYQARFSGTINGGTATLTWKYESAADTYTAFSPAAAMASPAVNTSTGTPVGWARIVIDPCQRKYVSFEIPNISSGGTTVYDPSGANPNPTMSY